MLLRFVPYKAAGLHDMCSFPTPSILFCDAIFFDLHFLFPNITHLYWLPFVFNYLFHVFLASWPASLNFALRCTLLRYDPTILC